MCLNVLQTGEWKMKKSEEMTLLNTTRLEKEMGDLAKRIDEIFKSVADCYSIPEYRLRGMTKDEWDLYCADRRNNVI